MTYDYEQLKIRYETEKDQYRRHKRNFLDLPDHVPLQCFICGKEFTRERYRVINRLRDGVEHSFCGKGCASKFVREQEFADKLCVIEDVTFEDFFYGRISRRDDIAYMKRPLYRIRCSNPRCYQFMTRPWEQWIRAITPKSKGVYCSDGCKPESNRAQRGTRSGSGTPERLFQAYVAGARRRNRTFELSFDRFKDLVTSNCVYCGKAPMPLNGVDRLNSTIGYVLSNCVSACSQCNVTKMDYSVDDFISHSFEIINHQLLNTIDAKTSLLDIEKLNIYCESLRELLARLIVN